ncbi:hypothetical protein TBLA_0A00860 [Henningerozyma blattae CBS 6284]|uniref:Uncharacterized protein n=1 Tax=Henningerozyma blattae (strain ATCC 34711 / CBS 6284 / DSM 70876 / NBRC 10599 / NRRL Y-10934 / UCD 77-7) TaxID=1071380 RepID=I2GUT4_HENB6|nr:hypothetical protein TBLA_0A00860 [Tetrapisispora blattae CBS 6284]CCH57886.1 hypothetical protein TBLA_0A00860 [Tetrapisispora blattae CBS 6284]
MKKYSSNMQEGKSYLNSQYVNEDPNFQSLNRILSLSSQKKKGCILLNSPEFKENSCMIQNIRKSSLPTNDLIKDVINYLDDLETYVEESSRKFRIISIDANGHMKQPDIFGAETGLIGETSNAHSVSTENQNDLSETQNSHLIQNEEVTTSIENSNKAVQDRLCSHKENIAHVESLINKLQSFPGHDLQTSYTDIREPEYSSTYEYYKFKLLSHSLSYLRRKSVTSNNPFYEHKYKKRVLRKQCTVIN